jgi:hypothetical protein
MKGRTQRVCEDWADGQLPNLYLQTFVFGVKPNRMKFYVGRLG